MLIHLLRPATFFKDVPVNNLNMLEEYYDDDYFGEHDVNERTKFKKYISVSPLDLTYQQEPNSAC